MTPNIRRNRFLRLLPGIILSAIAIIALILEVNWRQTLQAWAEAQLWVIVPAVALIAGAMFTRAVAWRCLMRNSVSLRKAFWNLNISYMLNSFLPFRLGDLARAYLVPRHPVNIPLDVCTHEALLRQRGAAAATGVVDTLERSDVLALEATLILTHLLSNDPRPHYTHQNALVGDRLLLGLLDGVLQSFRALIRTRPVQLTLAEAGRELLRRRAWSQVIGQGAVSARDTDGAIEIVNDSARSVEVPWAGPDVHGGWVTVPAGGRQVIPNRQAQR